MALTVELVMSDCSAVVEFVAIGTETVVSLLQVDSVSVVVGLAVIDDETEVELVEADSRGLTLVSVETEGDIRLEVSTVD